LPPFYPDWQPDGSREWYLRIHLTADDVNGDALTFSAVGLPEGFTAISPMATSLGRPLISSGEYQVTFTVQMMGWGT